MNEEEFKDVSDKTFPIEPWVSVGDLKDHTDRTLIWGYDMERNSFHVYLDAGRFIAVTYDFQGDILSRMEGTDIKATDAIPNKRVYPEACDYEFCSLLCTKDIVPPFTKFNPERPAKTFHGKRLDELNQYSQDVETGEISPSVPSM